MTRLALSSPLSTLSSRVSAAYAALRGRPVAGTAQLTRASVADFTPIMWAGRRMTPDQVRFIIEGAVGGNLAEQWALFDMMEDTWPRLSKNLAELRNAAKRVTYSVQPYAERGEKPTESAKDRADLVEAALRNWRPKPGTLELGFEDALFDAMDAIGKGLSVLEVSWQRAEEGLLPRCAHLLHPTKYGWNADGTELGLVSLSNSIDGRRSTAWEPFPPGQFWVGVWHSRSGVPGQTAMLRSLAPYWVGITFGWEWLLTNAQIFGVPFRWATYDPNQPQNLAKISDMLANLGAAGWAAFPQGTTLDFKEAITASQDNPQVLIQTLADKYADQLILGQEASSESKPAGIGNGASELHGSVRADRLQDAAQWCADLLNYQLVPAVLRWNWGDESEPPTIVPEFASETDPKARAERDQVLAQIAPMPRKWFYERHGIPLPEEGEETVGGASSFPTFPPLGGPSSESAAPGQPSDAGSPATAGNEKGEEKTRVKHQGNPDPDEDTDPAAKRARMHSPRFAVASARASTSAAAPLPGAYQSDPETKRVLAAAHARDFAPLRKAAEPLLAAIEAGELGVVGELEAFIARLDELAPQIVGARELADALEAALAEASIQGAAQTYAKIPEKK